MKSTVTQRSVLGDTAQKVMMATEKVLEMVEPGRGLGCQERRDAPCRETSLHRPEDDAVDYVVRTLMVGLAVPQAPA
jgi:hypothetical protein